VNGGERVGRSLTLPKVGAYYYGDNFLTFVSPGMNILVPQIGGNFLTK